MSSINRRGTVRVAFDSSALKARYRNHGIQVYARNLLGALRESAPQHGMEIRPFVSSLEEMNALSEQEPGFRPRKTRLLGFDRVWRYGGATAAAFLDGADILFNPNGASLPINMLLPTVTTIHDLTPMVMPCFPRRISFLLKFLLMRSAKSSAALITVSENSRQDIVRLCGVPQSKIHVVYEGYDRALFNEAAPDQTLLQTLLSRLGISRPYILHHGAIQPRKNLPRLIAAYRQMLARNSCHDFDLVLSGPLAWQVDETVAAAQDKSGNRGKVVLTGALSDQDLSMLLRGAALEVVPSLYEGFCLPMVEAMACGVPTIAANSSCLPEISGSVLRYFDPYSVDELVTRMEEAVQSEDLRAELAARGKERARQFSWELCAQQTLVILAQVARTSRTRARAAGVAL
ncbi:MAG: glycosyltransferase family 4 protein [Acidobacteriia bacterium]|nr:glycosyltransferase family 4 protein [Terriglobia bacterium]